MGTSSKNLALRDPALAAALGITPGADFGSDYGFGADELSGDYGDDVGFGADAAPAPPANPQQLMALWRQHNMQKAHARRREMILTPNKGSPFKVGRYSFSASQAITMGTAVALTLTNNPDTDIRPQRVVMNAPSPGFATISEIKAANVSVQVGGVSDAWEYNSNGVGQSLDMPTITPAMKVTVLGSYTGFTPAGFVVGQAYTFIASFKGPAAVTPES